MKSTTQTAFKSHWLHVKALDLVWLSLDKRNKTKSDQFQSDGFCRPRAIFRFESCKVGSMCPWENVGFFLRFKLTVTVTSLRAWAPTINQSEMSNNLHLPYHDILDVEKENTQTQPLIKIQLISTLCVCTHRKQPCLFTYVFSQLLVLVPSSDKDTRRPNKTQWQNTTVMFSLSALCSVVEMQ